MATANRDYLFRVKTAGDYQMVVAKSAGAAARKVFRRLIHFKKIKRQPHSSREGGWEGTQIACLGPV